MKLLVGIVLGIAGTFLYNGYRFYQTNPEDPTVIKLNKDIEEFKSAFHRMKYEMFAAWRREKTHEEFKKIISDNDF